MHKTDGRQFLPRLVALTSENAVGDEAEPRVMLHGPQCLIPHSKSARCTPVVPVLGRLEKDSKNSRPAWTPQQDPLSNKENNSKPGVDRSPLQYSASLACLRPWTPSQYCEKKV